jgi:hypothetical protein
MSPNRLVRSSLVLSIAVGFVAGGSAEAQIFRRPAGAAQPPSNSPAPRGLFPGRALRGGQNPDGQSTRGSLSGGAIPNTVNRPATAVPGGATTTPSPQEEIFVVVPLDDKPFTIEPTDYVRLAVGGPPGCEFSTKIEGPARLHRKVFIAGSTEGKYAVGTDEAEYEFAMTGLGKVKIDVIVTPANVPNAPAPTVMTYRFEVVAPKN